MLGAFGRPDHDRLGGGVILEIVPCTALTASTAKDSGASNITKAPCEISFFIIYCLLGLSGEFSRSTLRR